MDITPDVLGSDRCSKLHRSLSKPEALSAERHAETATRVLTITRRAEVPRLVSTTAQPSLAGELKRGPLPQRADRAAGGLDRFRSVARDGSSEGASASAQMRRVTCETRPRFIRQIRKFSANAKLTQAK